MINEQERGSYIEGKSQRPDIFVSERDEWSYLGRNHAEIRRLKNGATILGMTQRSDDEAQVSVRYTYSSGAYFDPKGKSGLHHLLEHLVSKRPYEVASKFDAQYGAATSPHMTQYGLNGILNPQIEGYGVLPALPLLHTQAARPIDTIGNLQSAIETEIGVILGEIKESKSRHEDQLSRALCRVLFDPENPINTNVPGTYEDLLSITPEDVVEISNRVFSPDNLVITVFGKGKEENTSLVVDQIEDSTKGLPESKVRHPSVDRALFDLIHPDFKPGSIYTYDTGMQTGMVTVLFVWNIASPENSTESMASIRLMENAQLNLHSFFRDEGLGYSSSVNSDCAGQYVTQSLRLNIPARQDIVDFSKALAPQLQTSVFEKIKDSEIEHMLEIYRKRQLATPIKADTRFNYLVNGILHYGKIIDADEMSRRSSAVTPSHLKEWRDTFLATPPAVLVVGDLSSA